MIKIIFKVKNSRNLTNNYNSNYYNNNKNYLKTESTQQDFENSTISNNYYMTKNKNNN